MAKFRYYITDICDGCIKGTNTEAVALEFAQCEDYFVVDTASGKWLAGNAQEEIPEAKVWTGD